MDCGSRLLSVPYAELTPEQQVRARELAGEAGEEAARNLRRLLQAPRRLLPWDYVRFVVHPAWSADAIGEPLLEAWTRGDHDDDPRVAAFCAAGLLPREDHVSALTADFCRACPEVALVAEGAARYRVLTPFMFDDGDHLVIVLRREEDRWALSDEGHTLMRAFDADLEGRLPRETRSQRVIDALTTAHRAGLELRESQLALPLREGLYGEGLLRFARAILKIAEIYGCAYRARGEACFRVQSPPLCEPCCPKERGSEERPKCKQS